MPDYGLAFHTTSSQLGLAISNFQGDCRLKTWDLGRDLSSHLHSCLGEFIAPQTWNDLKFIAVAKGPGSFTSSRIGMVTARTLAQQLEIPLFAISTLAGAAWSVYTQKGFDEKNNSFLPVQMDARRGELFVAIYEPSENNSGLVARLADTTMKPEKWQETFQELGLEQAINLPEKLGITVDSILELAYLNWQQRPHPHWSDALPFYGQHPVF